MQSLARSRWVAEVTEGESINNFGDICSPATLNYLSWRQADDQGKLKCPFQETIGVGRAQGPLQLAVPKPFENILPLKYIEVSGAAWDTEWVELGCGRRICCSGFPSQPRKPCTCIPHSAMPVHCPSCMQVVVGKGRPSDGLVGVAASFGQNVTVQVGCSDARLIW